MVASPECEGLRATVRIYLDSGRALSAQYWADKLLSIGGESDFDCVLYIRALLAGGEFERTLSFIRARRLEQRSQLYVYFAAQCLFELQRYQEAACLIEQPLPALATAAVSEAARQFLSTTCAEWRIRSALLLLQGRIFEQSDNWAQAVESFKSALQEDAYCYEALHALTSYCLLTVDDEQQLVDSLPLQLQCADIDAQLLRALYRIKASARVPLLKANSDSAGSCRPLEQVLLCLPESLRPRFASNGSIVTAMAERLYCNSDFRAAYQLLSEVLRREPFFWDCLPTFVCVLVELDKRIELFALAHRLVGMFPDEVLSWHAVGCYYYLIGAFGEAKKYLHKACLLDARQGPAWLMYGHAFAAEQQHDQAMRRYLKASKVMKGCHLPLLYIGLEYCNTNNWRLGDKFFDEALKLAPHDPHVLHEMGVLAFKEGAWSKAEHLLKEALSEVAQVHQLALPGCWEPLLNNLAHTCRKQKKYDEALEYYQRALLLSPRNATTLGNIGFVHLLTGAVDDAIDFFHQSLSLRRDNKNVNTLLTKAIDVSVAADREPNWLKALPAVPDAEPVLQLPKARQPSAAGSSMQLDSDDMEMDT